MSILKDKLKQFWQSYLKRLSDNLADELSENPHEIHTLKSEKEDKELQQKQKILK